MNRRESWLNLNHLALAKESNRVGASLETDPVSETLCFLVFRTPDDWQSPETQYTTVRTL
jgi:hypothetical protein